MHQVGVGDVRGQFWIAITHVNVDDSVAPGGEIYVANQGLQRLVWELRVDGPQRIAALQDADIRLRIVLIRRRKWYRKLPSVRALRGRAGRNVEHRPSLVDGG